MSRNTKSPKVTDESDSLEISESELAELRSLYQSTASLNKKFRTAADGLKPLYREVLKQLERGSGSNADEIDEQMKIIRATKGVSAAEKRGYDAIAASYWAAAMDASKKRDQAREAANALAPLAESIGSRRRMQIAATYKAALKAAAIAIRPFCEDEDEAEDMARTASRVSTLHARIIGNDSFSTNEIDRALTRAGAVLRDIEEPIPTFS